MTASAARRRQIAISDALRPFQRASGLSAETRLHLAVAEYLGHSLEPGIVWWHTPNGGMRSASEAALFQRMGVLPGVADLTFVRRGLVYFIELKDWRGTQSEGQIAFEARCKAQGAPYQVCHSIDEVERTLARWGFELRGHVA